MNDKAAFRFGLFFGWRRRKKRTDSSSPAFDGSDLTETYDCKHNAINGRFRSRPIFDEEYQ
ncbi:MAG: hypothetical protein ACE5I7_20785 [Candidatus Binatia bacterium]